MTEELPEPGRGAGSETGAKPRRWIVVRVNFTADDLARTRFSVAPAPLIETGLALVELRRATVTPGRPAARRSFRPAGGEARCSRR